MKGVKNIKTKALMVVLFSVFYLSAINTYADDSKQNDPLLLTPAEMKKLSQYFPEQQSEEGQHFVWQGNPISIDLPLNQEKRVIFPSGVTPDLKGALTTDQLKIINDHDSLYLTALKPFSQIRMFVTVQNSNDVIMVDLSTAAKADNSLIYIDNKSSNIGNNNNSINESGIITSIITNEGNDDNNGKELSGNDAGVALTRYAWQQLFAPDRLVSTDGRINRTPMHTVSFISNLIYGDKVYAHPLISWSLNHTYVTAVELRNKYPHFATINLSRDLCGNWQSASLYPRTNLKPTGDKTGDSTVLFVTSQMPFSDAMEICDGRA